MNYDSLRENIIPQLVQLFKILLIVFLCVHSIMLVSFFVTKLWLLVGVEVISVLIYIYLVYKYRGIPFSAKDKLIKGIQITTIELLVHMCVAMILLGTTYGFQHYIYGILVFVMFEGYLSNNRKRTLFLVETVLAGYLFARFWLIVFGAWYSTTNSVLEFLYSSLNPIVIMFFMAYYIVVLIDIVSRFDKTLIFNATHDKLTRLPNRVLFSELDKSHNYNVSILDVDDFKRVNDTYGHAAGDEVLKYLSKCLISIEDKDRGISVYRWGGEEFLVVSDNAKTNVNELLSILEGLRGRVEESVVCDIINFTITIGVADSGEGNSLDNLVKIADNRLYVGKNSGKNKIVYK